MIPGMTNFPVPSIVFTPAGMATSVPTAVILPFRTRIVPFWMSPRVIVMIVAFLIARSCAASALGTAGAANAAATTHRLTIRAARSGKAAGWMRMMESMVSRGGQR